MFNDVGAPFMGALPSGMDQTEKLEINVANAPEQEIINGDDTLLRAPTRGAPTLTVYCVFGGEVYYYERILRGDEGDFEGKAEIIHFAERQKNHH